MQDLNMQNKEYPIQIYDKSEENNYESETSIFESVNAILKKEVTSFLRSKSGRKLFHEIKICPELFDITELENGMVSLNGSLKAILHCQILARSFMKKSVPVKEDNNDTCPGVNSKISISSCSSHFTLSDFKEMRKPCDSVIYEKDPSSYQIDVYEKPLSSHKNGGKSIVTSIITLGLPSKATSINSIKKSDLEYKKLLKSAKTFSTFCTHNENNDKEEFSINSKIDDVFGESTTEICIEDDVPPNERSFISLTANLPHSTAHTPCVSSRNVKFSCNICPFQCVKESQFVKHLKCHQASKQAKSVKYECNICDGIFDSPSVYEQHIYDHQMFENERTELRVGDSLSAKLVCEICGYEAKQRREYKSHMENTHPTMFFCPQCSYKTSKKGHHTRHIRNVHENRRPFECQECNVSFKRRDALKQHQVIHLKNNKPDSDSASKTPPFRCKVCKKVVRSAAYLREHMLTHSEERSFLCEVCGASFKTRAVHRNHLKVVHSQDPKVVCSFCGKNFATPFSLKRHMSLHKQCDIYPKEEKISDKLNLLNAQESTDEWNSLLHCSDMGSEVSITTESEEKDVASLSKPDCIVATMAEDSPDKTIASIYSDSGSADNFEISIDSQIPYIIHSTQEVTCE